MHKERTVSNYPCYASEVFDQALERALSEADVMERRKFYANAGGLPAQEMHVIPVFHYAFRRLVHPHVGSNRHHVLGT